LVFFSEQTNHVQLLVQLHDQKLRVGIRIGDE